jgi:hypothetical protein
MTMILTRCGYPLALGVVLLLGCKRTADEPYEVSGTVSHQGAPVPMGTVFFDPDSELGGSGSQGFAIIRDGKFNTAAEGEGVHGGAYILRVQGFDGKSANEAPYGQPLFPEYQMKTEFPQENTTLDIDVPDA